MERVSGLLSDIKPLTPERERCEVIRYRVGDIVYLPLQKLYAKVDAIKPSGRDGHCVFNLAVPTSNVLQRWGRRNPDKVKRLVIGHSSAAHNVM